jgi:hypothetical protein
MAYKIIYSNLAIETLNANVVYLKNRWPKRSLTKFVGNVNKTIELIKQNPEFFPIWKDEKNKRKALVFKQITMFYNIKKNTIEILLFWNNYQNPSTLIDLIL